MTDYDTLAVSVIFDRGKTIVPSRVRKEMSVKDKDKLVWLENPLTKEIIVKPSIESKGRYQTVVR